jgi:hypothetical protein
MTKQIVYHKKEFWTLKTIINVLEFNLCKRYQNINYQNLFPTYNFYVVVFLPLNN